MNIFSRITAKTMKENKTRTIVTIIGVILSTAMITAVVTLGSSFRNFLIQHTLETDGNWHVAGEGLPVSKAEEIASQPEVKKSAAVTELGYALYKPLESPMMPYLYVQSLSREAMDLMPVFLSEGRMPDSPEEVIIPDYLLANMGEETIKVGDQLSLELGERTYEGERLHQTNSYMGTETKAEESFVPKEKKEFQVVGIYDYASFVHSFGAPGYELYAGPGETDGTYVDLYLELNDPKEVYTFMDTFLEDVGAVTNVGLLRWYGVVDNEPFSQVYIGLLAILIVVIMTGSILLIYNAFSISFRERSAQFGLLSSLGATKKQLKSAMRYEAFLVSLLGIPLGILSGIGGIGVTLHFIGKGISSWFYGQEKEISLVVEPWPIFLAGGIAFVTIWLSAWIPSRRIKKLSPMEAIRSSEDIKVRPKEVKTSPWVFRLFGLSGMMADKNYKRDRKKYRTTVVSLSISMVLFTTASLFQTYLMETGAFVLKVPSVDVECSMYQPEKQKGAEKILANQEGVTKQKYYDITQFLLRIPREYLNPNVAADVTVFEEEAGQMSVLSGILAILPDERFEELRKEEGISEKNYEGTEELRFLYVLEVNAYHPSTQRYERQRVFQGEEECEIEIGQVLYEENKGKEETKFQKTGTAVLGDSLDALPEELGTLEGSEVFLLSQSMYEEFQEFFASDGIQRVYQLWCEDSGRVCKNLAKEWKALGIEEMSITDLRSYYEQDRSTLMAIRVLTYGFLILISLIAVANVFHTISTNLMLRRKEFAMLRSMGMSPKGFNRMLYYECLIYGGRSIFYGTILTILVSFLICKVIGFGADTGFVMPYGALLVSISGVFLVVFASMVYTMCKIRKNNIIEELKMT